MRQMVKGSDLGQQCKDNVLGYYMQRHTGNNIPKWAKQLDQDGTNSKLQFASDDEWLDNTHFVVTKHKKLDKRTRFCFSQPTWPKG